MRTEEQKAYLWKAVDRQRDSYFPRAHKVFLSALNQQIAAAIVAVESGNDPEAAITPQPIQAAMVEVYVLVGVAFAKEQYRGLKSHEADYGTKAAAEESVWTRFMRRWALTKAGERIKGITDTTLKQFRRIQEQAVAEGLSIPNTVKLITKEFSEINPRRATVQARTEIISSSNQGSLLGAQSTGLALNKSWLATRGARTRADHRAADGQTVGLEEPFKVGGEELQYPGDPEGSAGNVIQCRCTQIYEPK